MRRIVTVVSREGCHLCENVLETLRSLSSLYDVEVRVLDISDDQKLHDRYWLTIPAIQIEGKDVFDARDMVAGVDYASTLERLLTP
jgi:hypothetical protein